MRHQRQAEPDRRRPELERGGVDRVRRDPEPDSVGQRTGDAVAVRLEALGDLTCAGAEDLDVDDRAQPELVTGRGRGAAEARVADARDPRGEAFGRAEAGDRRHLLEADPALALDVDGEPFVEREAVAEPCVDRVLEVGVGVDEAGEDDGAVEALSLAELVACAYRRDAIPLDRDRAVRDRLALDREHPVGGVDGRHSGWGHKTPARAQRRSITAASQIENSKRSTIGIASNVSDTGSTVGSSTATSKTRKIPSRRLRRSRSALKIWSRTSASTKIGSSKMNPRPTSASETNEK